MLAELASGALGYVIGKLNQDGQPSAGISPITPVTQPTVYQIKPILILKRYSGSDTTYQELVRWDNTQYTGILEAFSIDCDSFADLMFTIQIGNLVTIADGVLMDILNCEWAEDGLLLQPQNPVIISVMSSTGNSIKVDVFLRAKELRK